MKKLFNVLIVFFIRHRFVTHFTSAQWGDSVLIMEISGKAFGRMYYYYDDRTTVYLDWLSVDENARMKGIGTKLQEMREEIGRRLGAKTSLLWVYKNTWMHDWYQRRGYEFYADYSGEENAIWMIKKLQNDSN